MYAESTKKLSSEIKKLVLFKKREENNVSKKNKIK